MHIHGSDDDDDDNDDKNNDTGEALYNESLYNEQKRSVPIFITSFPM
jgi:hypothetical protein